MRISVATQINKFHVSHKHLTLKTCSKLRDQNLVIINFAITVALIT